MTDPEVIKDELLALCNRHYAQTRHIPTVIAVPAGMKQQFVTSGYAPGQVDGVVLIWEGHIVSLEELELLTDPTVLSDHWARR